MTPVKKAAKKTPKKAATSPARPISTTGAVSPTDIAGAVSPTDLAGAVSPTDLAGAVSPTDLRAWLSEGAKAKGIAFNRVRGRENEYEPARVAEYRVTLSSGGTVLVASVVAAEWLRMEALIAAARRGADIGRPPWSILAHHDVEEWLLATYPPKGL